MSTHWRWAGRPEYPPLACFCGAVALCRVGSQGFCKAHREHAVKGMKYMAARVDNATIGIDEEVRRIEAEKKIKAQHAPKRSWSVKRLGSAG